MLSGRFGRKCEIKSNRTGLGCLVSDADETNMNFYTCICERIKLQDNSTLNYIETKAVVSGFSTGENAMYSNVNKEHSCPVDFWSYKTTVLRKFDQTSKILYANAIDA